MDFILGNPYILNAIKIALVVYGGAVAPALPPKVLLFLRQIVPQFLFLAAIAYINFGIHNMKYVVIGALSVIGAVKLANYYFPAAEAFSIFGFDPVAEAQAFINVEGPNLLDTVQTSAVVAANAANNAIQQAQNGNMPAAVAAATLAANAANTSANAANTIASSNAAYANTAAVANSMANSANTAAHSMANGNVAQANAALGNTIDTANGLLPQ